MKPELRPRPDSNWRPGPEARVYFRDPDGSLLEFTSYAD